jgi:hypothetical protein
MEIGLEIRVECCPLTGVLFRPEEIHPGSTPGAIFRWPAYLTIGIAHHVVGVYSEHLLVSHLNHDGSPTVQTGGVDPHCLAGKEPANR